MWSSSVAANIANKSQLHINFNNRNNSTKYTIDGKKEQKDELNSELKEESIMLQRKLQGRLC